MNDPSVQMAKYPRGLGDTDLDAAFFRQLRAVHSRSAAAIAEVARRVSLGLGLGLDHEIDSLSREINDLTRGPCSGCGGPMERIGTALAFCSTDCVVRYVLNLSVTAIGVPVAERFNVESCVTGVEHFVLEQST